MALVRVFSPETESEVAVVTAMLEAREIPVFVHNRNLGSLLPGLQINAYNTQSIMVPEECAADAIELLAEFRTPSIEATTRIVPVRDRIRIVIETLLFGWFVPGGARDVASKDEEQPDAGR